MYSNSLVKNIRTNGVTITGSVETPICIKIQPLYYISHFFSGKKLFNFLKNIFEGNTFNFVCRK